MKLIHEVGLQRHQIKDGVVDTHKSDLLRTGFKETVNYDLNDSKRNLDLDTLASKASMMFELTGLGYHVRSTVYNPCFKSDIITQSNKEDIQISYLKDKRFNQNTDEP